MFESLAKALAAGLSIWEHKEKNKYIDRLERIRKDYREEYNKPIGVRSDAVLDDLEFQLRLAADSFAASVSGK